MRANVMGISLEVLWCDVAKVRQRLKVVGVQLGRLDVGNVTELLKEGQDWLEVLEDEGVHRCQMRLCILEQHATVGNVLEHLSHRDQASAHSA
mgnify:CR=1 FL=1